MGTAIIGLLTPLIPVLVKLIYMWIDKKQEDDEAKRRFLAFIDSIRGNVPQKLYMDHIDQVKELRKQILADEERARIDKQNSDSYRELYEKTYQEKLDQEEKNRKMYAENLRLEDEKLRMSHELDRLRTDI
jgi:hypothetical protein